MGKMKAIALEAEESRRADPKAEQAEAKTKSELVALGKRRGYKNPKFWAERVLDGRRKK